MLHPSFRIIFLCIAILAIGLLIGYFWGVHNGRKALEQEILLSAPVNHLTNFAPFSPAIVAWGDSLNEGFMYSEDHEGVILDTQVSLGEDTLILRERPGFCGGMCATFTLTPALLQSIPLFTFSFSSEEEIPLVFEDDRLQDLLLYYSAHVYMSDMFITEAPIEVRIPRGGFLQDILIQGVEEVYVSDMSDIESFIEKIVFF